MTNSEFEKDEKLLIKHISKLNLNQAKSILDAFEKVLVGTNIEPGDGRVCFSLTKGKVMGLTYGQRYTLIVSSEKQASKIQYIDTEDYEGGWLQTLRNWNDLDKIIPKVVRCGQKELDRTSKSSYLQHSSKALEKAIFDKVYRDRLLKSINTIEKIKKEFKAYLERVIPKSARNYLSGIPTVDRIAITNKLLEESVYEITNEKVFENFVNKINSVEQYNEKNIIGHNMFSAALKKYSGFLKELNNPKLAKKATTMRTTATNTILYGPAGTGKTYKLKTDYFPKYTTQETSLTPEKYFENIVKDLTWWEVTGLALLELKKAKVSDIASNKWVKTKTSLSESNSIRATIWGQLQSHTIEECEFVNYRSKQAPYIFYKTKDSIWEIIDENVKEQAPELFDILDSVNSFIPNPDKQVKRYIFTTFHQSYAYEEFIEGIKPILGSEAGSKELSYTIEPGVFKQLCKDAENDPEHRYAIFIDEINRGNVSNVFGELITLIETDKRKGADNEISVTLPYSKSKFSVPNNLDIYGTMNTADRSVEALDTALRRRFNFVEMLPDPSILKTEKVEGIKLSDVLQKINERVEVLVDRDHTIGHSYFINVDSEEKLAIAFKDKIVPLLQEYFYGDYGKIGLVLGDGFVSKVKGKNDVFAGFEYDGQADFITDSYKLTPINKTNIVDAVAQLLNDKKAGS